MFGRSQPALPLMEDAFPGVTLPELTEDDLDWQKRFLKKATKRDDDTCRQMLDQALTSRDIRKVAAGLRIQQVFPERDFLRHGHPVYLYTDVWQASTPILELYILTYFPSETDHGNRIPAIAKLPKKTRQRWLEQDCEEFFAQILLSFAASGDVPEAVALLSDPRCDIEAHDNKILRFAIKNGNMDFLSAVLDKEPDFTEDSYAILKTAIDKNDEEILDLLIQRGLNIFADEEAGFTYAREQGKLKLLKQLINAKQTLITETGIIPGTTESLNWQALSDTFVEYTPPAGPDSPKTKYQIDFDAGYVSYHHEKKNGYAPFALKSLGEVFAENPQMIDKAVKTLTDTGYPAPDLSRLFNQAAPKAQSARIVPPRQTGKPPQP